MAPTKPDSLAAALQRHAPVAAAMEPRLAAALRQVLGRPGKLLRAALTSAGARRAGLRRAEAEKLACAVEYFHAASLVLDDLPCMDDATLRRGLPCVHRQHGDATAILTSLALINRAYALVAEVLAAQPRRVQARAWATVERSLGVAGLVGGQAWDLAFAGTERPARLVSRIAEQKTGALFALAILLPAELARPDAGERRALRALSVYWGQLFQITDDLRDVLASAYEAGKTTGRDAALARPNLVLALGLPAARRRIVRLAAQAARALAVLEHRGGARRWGHLREAAAALNRLLVVPEAVPHAA